jgi:putative membrane protein
VESTGLTEIKLFSATTVNFSPSVHKGVAVMMSTWAGWGGFGMGTGWLFMILVWGVIIFAFLAALKWLISADSGGSALGSNSALEILKQRYARGEIGSDEYEKKRRELRA